MKWLIGQYIGKDEHAELIKMVREHNWKKEDFKKARPELSDKVIDDILKEVEGGFDENGIIPGFIPGTREK